MPDLGRCTAFVEGGGVLLARSRKGTERRHRRCSYKAVTVRTYVGGREVVVCTLHAKRIDEGLPINARSNW
jgi:nitrite reductase/ring-hydroxylating ferredoxin subunit